MKRDWLLPIGSLIQFALLLPLIRWARKHQQPLSELAATRLLQRKQTTATRTIVKVLNTLTGSSVFLNSLVVPITAVVLWKMRLRSHAFAVLTSCWTGVVALVAIKRLTDRPRPPLLLVRNKKQTSGKSFPSGHVASSMCLWGWIMTLGWMVRRKISPGKRVALGIPTLFVAFTGPARVYLGDHWATDVLGGYLFGGGWLSFSLYLYLRWEKAFRGNPPLLANSPSLPVSIPMVS